MKRPFAACSVVALLLASGQGLAQCDIYRLDVPDLDQYRSTTPNTPGLPGNGGMHCVPTSQANWFAYINNHGYPGYFGPNPGPLNWQAADTYNEATGLIDYLGQLMDTSPDGGTSYSKGSSGFQELLDIYFPGEFVCSTSSASGTFAPRGAEIYNAMVAGQLVSFGTSRWTLHPATTQLPARYVRSAGGHAQSAIRIYNGCSASPIIYARNPAGTTDSTTAQSPFYNTVNNGSDVYANYANDATSAPVLRTQLRLLPPPDQDYFTAINALMLTTPKSGLTANAQLGQYKFHALKTLDFGVLTPTAHNTPGNAPILAAKLHPQFNHAILIAREGGPTSSAGRLYRARTDGSLESLGTLASPGPCTFGRNGEFFIADGGVIRSLDLSGPAMVESASFTVAGAGIGAMTYDDTTDRVIVVCPGRGSIGSCAAVNGRGFGADYSEDPIPAVVPVAGDVFIAASPVNGSLFICSQGSPDIWKLDKLASGGGFNPVPVLLPAVQCCPRFVAADHRGHLIFTINGVVQEVRQNLANGQWENDPTSKFAGLVAGDLFEQLAARSTADEFPADWQHHTNPANEGTSSTPDCRADFNASGAISVQDIFDYLAAYFAGCV